MLQGFESPTCQLTLLPLLKDKTRIIFKALKLLIAIKMGHHEYTDDELQTIISNGHCWNDILTTLEMKTMTRSLQKRIEKLHINHDHISKYFDGLHTKINKFTKETLEEIVQSNTQWIDVMKQIGYKSCTHVQMIQKKMDELNIDYSHLPSEISSSWNRYTLDEILVKDSLYTNMSQLLKRLKKERGWKHECCKCHRSEWNNLPIPLEIDHIDGCHSNNTYENLRPICCNCHAQTDTYKGKNMNVCKNNPHKKPKVEPKPRIIHEDKQCQGCNKPIDRRYNQCIDCKSKTAFESGQHRKVERPSYEQLKEELKHTPMVHVAKKYGVSDNAVRKWLKQYEKYYDLNKPFIKDC